MSITLNTKAYAFQGFINGVTSIYRYVGSGVVAGFRQLLNSVQIRGATQPTLVKWTVKIPVVADDDSACGCSGDVLREYIADISLKVPAGGSTVERTDFALSLKDLTASPEFQASVISLQQASV